MSSSGIKAIAVAGALAVVALIVIGMQLQPSGITTGVKIGGPFTLVDQNGKTRNAIDFQGGYMLIYFGYTFCPDVCPTALNQMVLALDEVGKKASKVSPIFITVDPERDTSARLKSYAKNFHPRLIALTGDAAAISAAAKAYRVYYAKAGKKGEKKDASDEGYLMDHTSIIYLMGPDGRYITHFSHGTDVEKMAARIRDLIS